MLSLLCFLLFRSTLFVVSRLVCNHQDVAVERYRALRSAAWSQPVLDGYMDGLLAKLKASGAAVRDYDRWRSGTAPDLDAKIGALKAFLTDRLAWMDKSICGLCFILPDRFRAAITPNDPFLAPCFLL